MYSVTAFVLSKILRDRREKSESFEEVLKVESILRTQEQKAMTLEDKLAILISNFEYQTHEREIRKIREHIEALERHRAETAATNERRTEQLKASIRIQEANRERKERELMYFVEYNQRKVEWSINSVQSNECASEVISMVREDQLAQTMRATELEKERDKKILREETDKVIFAKLEGLKKYGGDGGRLGRTILERNADAKEYRELGNMSEISYPTSVSNATNCSNLTFTDRSVNTFISTKSELQRSMRIQCQLEDTRGGKESVFLRVAAVKDKRYAALTSKLDALFHARKVRRNDFRFLLEALAYFEIALKNINKIRNDYRKAKFPTKHARQAVLNEAVSLEKRLTYLQSDIDKYVMKLISILKEELEVFEFLFIKGGDKEFVYAHSPSLFKKKSQVENSAAGSWLQQKKTTTTISRRVTKIDHGGGKLKKGNFRAEKKSLEAEDSWYHESEEFLNNRIDIDRIDLTYFSDVRDSPMATIPRSEPCFVKDEAESTQHSCTKKVEINGSRLEDFCSTCEETQRKDKSGRRTTAGLSLYIDEDLNMYDFYVWAKSVIQWSKKMIDIMSSTEKIWRRHYRNHGISFYQRMIYVCNTEISLSTSSSAAIISHSDVTIPRAIDSADTLGLYEILCCRSGVRISVSLLLRTDKYLYDFFLFCFLRV